MYLPVIAISTFKPNEIQTLPKANQGQTANLLNNWRSGEASRSPHKTNPQPLPRLHGSVMGILSLKCIFGWLPFDNKGTQNFCGGVNSLLVFGALNPFSAFVGKERARHFGLPPKESLINHQTAKATNHQPPAQVVDAFLPLARRLLPEFGPCLYSSAAAAVPAALRLICGPQRRGGGYHWPLARQAACFPLPKDHATFPLYDCKESQHCSLHVRYRLFKAPPPHLTPPHHTHPWPPSPPHISKGSDSSLLGISLGFSASFSSLGFGSPGKTHQQTQFL